MAATANIPKMGLDKIFPGSSVNGGIIIAIIVVILIYLLLNKTTFGYELKAVGFNRDASKYAGINEKKSIIMSMMIAGAIAGLAGGLLYLAGTGKHIEIKDVLASEGFTGISVALLGLSNPIGVLFSGIFIAYLTAGGFYLRLFEFSTEIIDIIVAVIIYFSAFALMVKMLIGRVQKARHEKKRPRRKEEETHECYLFHLSADHVFYDSSYDRGFGCHVLGARWYHQYRSRRNYDHGCVYRNPVHPFYGRYHERPDAPDSGSLNLHGDWHVFSLFHGYASINMKANQVISGTALNMFAPAFAIFVARVIQGVQRGTVYQYLPYHLRSRAG